MPQLKTVVWSFVLAVLAVSPAIASAASLYIDPARSEINRGDAITLAVRLDVDEATGECVNVVDGVISYTSNLEPVDVSTGESIFSLWVEQPRINRDNQTITFAGGIPNGYCGRIAGDPRLTNVIAEIIFRSPGFMVGGTAEPLATVDFTDQTAVYLNRADGAKAPLATYGAEITLNNRAGGQIQNDWQAEVEADTIPPEEFSITLETNPVGKHYIVFNTTDKQTGIDHYEVMEEPLSQLGSFQWGRADAPWIQPDHPNVHLLDDQSLNSVIRVKAVDKAGNTYVATLIPDESMRTLSQFEVVMYSFGAGVLVMALILAFTVWQWFRKRRSTRTRTSHHEAPADDDESDAVNDEEEPDESYDK